MQGQRVLYTGAAGGLGCETTLELLAAGAEVYSIDLDQAKNSPRKSATMC
jgi:NAD(P)-dependent dehydrogenase (short-subunit alcohol dehydrogenase family)